MPRDDRDELGVREGRILEALVGRKSVYEWLRVAPQGAFMETFIQHSGLGPEAHLAQPQQAADRT